MWRIINSFDKPLRVGVHGEIEEFVVDKSHPQGHFKPKKAWYRPHSDDYAVCVTIGGKRKTRNAARIVFEAYDRPLRADEEITHLDGDKANREYANLEPHRTGWSRRRTVEKIDKDGRIIERYDGAVEAAQANYLTYSGMMYHLTGRARDPFKWCGYTFRFGLEEEEDNVEEC